MQLRSVFHEVTGHSAQRYSFRLELSTFTSSLRRIDNFSILFQTGVSFELTYNAPDGSVGTWQKEGFDYQRLEDDAGGGPGGGDMVSNLIRNWLFWNSFNLAIPDSYDAKTTVQQTPPGTSGLIIYNQTVFQKSECSFF